MLPWLLFGLLAGALADRWDRRLLVIVVDLIRAAVLAVLALTILTDTVSIAVLLAALFVLAPLRCSPTPLRRRCFPCSSHATTSRSERPDPDRLRDAEHAGRAAARGALFAAAWWPFAGQALLIAIRAWLSSRASLSRRPRGDRNDPVRHDIAEGFRWVLHHPAVRTLVLTIFIFNITYGAAWSVLVLYAQHLGMGEVGFGLLTTVSAIGGLAGTLPTAGSPSRSASATSCGSG